MTVLWDDPKRDFRQRYQLPDQFMWADHSWPRMDFDGYMMVVQSLLLKPPAKILDVGCGPGLGTKLLNEQGYEVTGVDYNERGIQFARLLVPGAQFLHEDVRMLSQASYLHSQFDAAIHVEVIEHIPPEYHAQTLQGIGKTLRASGQLILTVPSTNMPLNRWHYKHFSFDELSRLVEENGFYIKKVAYQHRLSLLSSPYIHLLLSNNIYDLRFAQRWLRSAFLRWFNTTNEIDKAGRFIIQAEKVYG